MPVQVLEELALSEAPLTDSLNVDNLAIKAGKCFYSLEWLHKEGWTRNCGTKGDFCHAVCPLLHIEGCCVCMFEEQNRPYTYFGLI